MASAAGIRAGAAYVELFVKDNRLTRGLAAASAKLKAFGAGITGLGTQLLGVGAAFAAPFVLATKIFTDLGSDLVDMSQRTGVSVEALSELGFAAEQSGADMETLEAGLRKMQKFVVEAADGSAIARDALQKLGLAFADLQALAPDDQFKLIADKLSKIENPALRAALAMAGACGPAGRVVACEPNPILTETYLPQNLALNGFYHGVEICPKVVGNLDDQAVEFVLNEGDFATSSLERWAYAHRCQAIQAPAITLDRLCADWPRLDLVKIDAEGAEALVWEGMQQTLRRFPHAAVVLELHLQRDPPQTVGFLHEIERAGYLLRSINYEGEVVPVEAGTILAQPQEHWTLWAQR